VKRQRAFTLIELLTVVAILGILGSILIPVVDSVRTQAKRSRETSAARSLINGYLLFAKESGGDLLPGYGPGPTSDFQGKSVNWPASYRYPFRLAPYLDEVLRGQLYVNDQALFYDSLLADPSVSAEDAGYELSLFPSFGLNHYFMGGHHEIGAAHGVRPLKRLDETVGETNRLIVFLSSKFSRGMGDERGYFQITSPNFPSKWPSSYSETAPAQTFGYVDPRWGGKAVAAMLGGHVELLSLDEMRDMRRWALGAVLADEPDWRP
jgi:prepilin-type N-terminal cleavage/methylation domain-containing protein